MHCDGIEWWCWQLVILTIVICVICKLRRFKFKTRFMFIFFPKPFMFIFFPINLNIDEMLPPYDIVSCQLSSFLNVSFIAIFQFHIIIQRFSKCVLFQFSTFWDMAPPIVLLYNFRFWIFFNFQICLGTFHVSSNCDFDCLKSSCDIK